MIKSIEATQDLLNEARAYKSELAVQMVPVAAFTAEVASTHPARTLDALPPNLLGLGFGVKQTEGATVEDQLAVRAYVRTKLPRSVLSGAEEIPAEVNGLPTDVIEVGDVTSLQLPTRCGVSVGHFAITAGTLGCLVRSHQNHQDDRNARLILSNNHVLANSNAGDPGDAILHPGPLDGGDPNAPIATLTDFEPIDFNGENAMDAAVARVVNPDDVDPEISVIGPVQAPPVVAKLFQSVRKHGRTTRHTVGVVVGLAEDINVRYGNRRASFENQLAIRGLGGDFSRGGDSGSLVVDGVGRNPVGLLFAGGAGVTFANRIEPVLDRFAIEIL